MNNVEYVKASLRPLRNTGVIKIHEAEDYVSMRLVSRLVADALDSLDEVIKPDITTGDIDDFIVNFAKKHNVINAPLNYKGFPKSVCTSVNHVVCHGIPSHRKILRKGHIVNVDVTFILDGWYGDSSRMYSIGEVSKRASSLIDVTYKALLRGILQVRPGARTGDIGASIQGFVEAEGMSVVTEFCGHGIGRIFHDTPNITHFGDFNTGCELRPGMFFTIEPMINYGKAGVKLLSDGWTAVTRDKSLSAQFEHSVAVTKSGCEVFTLSAKERKKYKNS